MRTTRPPDPFQSDRLRFLEAERFDSRRRTPPGQQTPSRNWYNVLDFGASGNGSSDDTDAIQWALRAAEADTGGTVYLPTGFYLIGSTVEVPEYCSLRGDSRYRPQIWTDFNGTALSLKGDGSQVIADLSVDTAGFAGGSANTGAAIEAVADGSNPVESAHIINVRTVSNGVGINLDCTSDQGDGFVIQGCDLFRSTSNGDVLALKNVRLSHLWGVQCLTTSGATAADVLIDSLCQQISVTGGHVHGAVSCAGDEVRMTGMLVKDAVTLTAASANCVLVGNRLQTTPVDNGTGNVVASNA